MKGGSMANKSLMLVIAALVAFNLSWADDAGAADEQLRAQLEQALKEIKQLRSEVAELKQNSNWQYQQQLKKVLEEAPPAAKDEAVSSFVLPAGWKFQPYGYFKFDMVYDDSAVTGEHGDYVIWVQPENDTTRGDDAFSFTARQTRLGGKLFAPSIGDVKVMGRVEIDFYNPVTASTNDNKSTPQMRHAYAEITGADWSLLFGQTSDVISPLFLNTINYTVGWFGGNAGYRRPQLRFTKWWDCSQGCRLKLETALSRDFGSNKGAGTVDDGQDASTPTIQSRVSYEIPRDGKKIIAGLSGHYGTEEIDMDVVGDDDRYHTWSLNTDILIPVNDMVEIKGEAFWAENFDSYFGGIGQGINANTADEITAVGGWAQVAITPCPDWVFNTGLGFDDPIDHDLSDSDRSLNTFAFTNVNYSFSKYLSTGIEFSYWRTDYKNSDDGDDFRVQHSWMLKF